LDILGGLVVEKSGRIDGCGVLEEYEEMLHAQKSKKIEIKLLKSGNVSSKFEISIGRQTVLSERRSDLERRI
jgi:hypothetical protein